MNLRYEILKACAANPGAPMVEICDGIKHDRQKTTWSVRDCAKAGLLSKRRDDVTGQPGYTLTAEGKQRLAEGPGTKQGGNMKKSDSDSEGGETDVKAQSAKFPPPVTPQIPPPQYDPDEVAFKEPADPAEVFSLLGVIADIRAAVGDKTGTIMLGELAEHIRAQVALLKAEPDMLRTELAKADAELLAQAQVVVQLRADLANEQALVDKLEHLLQSARNEAEHLRRHADHPGEAADMVNHPPHYQGSIECIDAIESALGPEGFRAYCRGTAMKYAWRAGKKGDAAEDMAKGAWYLSRAANSNNKETK